MTVRVALLVFEGCDLLDLGGPYEVLLTADRLAARRGLDVPFEVTTVGLTTEPVPCYGGLGLVAEQRVDGLAAVDVVVVPGLIDVARATSDAALVAAVVEGRRWVDAGPVVTGAGLSSGLDLGLHLVDRFAGRELAEATAAQIEHAWRPDSTARTTGPAGPAS